MLLMHPLRTLTPAYCSPRACFSRSSVTMEIGLSPAFSASVAGTISRASAKARTQKLSDPDSVLAYSIRRYDTSISGALPPGIRNLCLKRLLTTQSASWIDLSFSSSIILLEPRQRIEAVLQGLGTPVILTIFPSLVPISSTRSALPSFSGRRASGDAMGTHPRVLQMNSISSRSTSRTSMIFSFARKCRPRSVMASRRIDFCSSTTLHPVLATFLQMSAMKLRSSLSRRSICW
mmetsp:Transcript_8268/g.20543  ORF Transcript_8268/g.20543 Transcript_8268/m.20543 type:complete len:234 (+) Transcript_8268:216-917(+)